MLRLPAGAQLLQTRINQYPVPRDAPYEKVVVIKMPYAGYSIESVEGDTTALLRAGAIIIDVVCTDYPTEQSLARLNQNRLKALYRYFPALRAVPARQINCYRQLRGTDKEPATRLFHGLVIRFRSRQLAVNSTEELRRLDALLQQPQRIRRPVGTDSTLPAKALVPDKTPYYDPSMSLQGKRVTHIIGDTAFLRKKFLLPEGALVLDFRTARKKKLISKALYQRFRDRGHTWLTLYQPLEETATEPPEPPATGETDSIVAAPLMPDSTLLRIFGRNSWSNYVVVGDVTGSMYPYTAQLLRWLQLQFAARQTIRCVFYNDGDDREDDKKKPGKTGGIYLRQCTRYEEAEALVKNTMQRGAGGDFPENTGEALFVAQQRYPDARCLILIADNWAGIRDRFLIKHLQVPVHVLLCGSHGNDIHPDYLALARQTGGSLHTADEDINGLAEMKAGEQRVIGGRPFILRNGELTDAGETLQPVAP